MKRKGILKILWIALIFVCMMTAIACEEENMPQSSSSISSSIEDSSSLKEDNSTSSHEHIYMAKTYAQTCTTQGYTVYTCECGESYQVIFASATGHTYTEKVVAPTCIAKGYTLHTCHCGKSYKDNYVSNRIHEFSKKKQTTAPTCEKDGETVYACKYDDCNAEKKVSIPKLGHGEYQWFSVIAPGENVCRYNYKEIYCCVRCMGSCMDCETAVTQTTIKSAKGHCLNSDWKVTKEPTLTSQGVLSGYCAICGASDAKINLPTLSSGAYRKTTLQEETCTNEGLYEYSIIIQSANYETRWSGTIEVVVAQKMHSYNGHMIDIEHCYTIEELKEIFGENLDGFGIFSNSPDKCDEIGMGWFECETCTGEINSCLVDFIVGHNPAGDGTCSDCGERIA